MTQWEMAVMAMLVISFAGFRIAEGEKTRIAYIRAMRMTLMRMQDMIRYEKPDLFTLLMRIRLDATPQERQMTQMLHAAAGRIASNSNPQLVRLFSIESAKRAGYGVLNAEDRQAFEGILSRLGRTGAEDMIRQISMADEQLRQREKMLQGECRTRVRLIRTLGVTGGAAAFLLLV